MLSLIDKFTSHSSGIILITAAFVVLLWVIYFNLVSLKRKPESSQKIYLPYTLYSSFIILWVLSNSYFQSDLLIYYNESKAIAMALFANLVSYFAFAWAFVFSCKIISTRPHSSLKTWQKLVFCTLGIHAVAVNIIPGLTVKSVDIYAPGDFVINFGDSTSAFFISLLLLLILTFRNFIIYRRSPDRLSQHKSTYMIMGVIVFMTSTVIAHLAVPMLNDDFSLVWVPPALSIFESLLVGYAIVHNRFYSLRYISYVSIAHIVNGIIYLIPLLFIHRLEDTWVTFFILSVWVVITGALTRTSLEHIKSILNWVIYSKSGNPVENIGGLVGDFQHSSEQAIVKLNHMLNTQTGQIMKVSENAQSDAIIHYFNKGNSALVKDEIDYKIQFDTNEEHVDIHDIKRSMDDNGSALIIPILNDSKQVSHLFMVSKKESMALFKTEEISALQKLFENVNQYIFAEERVRKSQVLAGSIAHEIRNPLSKIKYHFERIDADMFGLNSSSLTPFASNDMQKIYKELADGKKAVQLGTKFIDVILDELQGKPIEDDYLHCLSVLELTQKTLDEYSFDSEEAKQKVHLDQSIDFVFKGSETLYSFVLFNLIKNAVHYFGSHPKSRVSIRFVSTPEQNQVVFTDTGPGIDEQQLPFIFDELYTRKKGGNGLGLAYCKRVMASFGGSITCCSIPGKFTEFTLNFPTVDEQECYAGLIGEVRSLLVGKRCMWVGNHASFNNIGGRIQEPSRTLHSFGLEVIRADDGDSALALLTKEKVDFILMPYSGIDSQLAFVSALRKGGGGPDAQVTPVIACYRESLDKNIHDKLRANVQGMLDTGLNELEFLQAIKDISVDGSLNILESLHGQRVLVVDDMQVNRLLVQAYLTKDGVEVFQASSGMEALKIIKKEHIDLVLMDIQMPQMDGFETTEHIRSYSPDIPVIAVSGEYGEQAIARIKATMDDHLVKPVTRTQLKQKLVNWLPGTSGTKPANADNDTELALADM